MIEKLDNILLASKRDTQDKINEIIGKMETFEANLLSMSRILERLLNRQGKDKTELYTYNSKKSQPAVCDICGKTKEEHNHQQVLKKRGINKGKLLREYFWCSENKSDFRQYKERGEG